MFVLMFHTSRQQRGVFPRNGREMQKKWKITESRAGVILGGKKGGGEASCLISLNKADRISVREHFPTAN